MRTWVLTTFLIAGCASGQVQTRQEGPFPAPPEAGATEVSLPHEDRGGDADFRAAASKAFASDPDMARKAQSDVMAGISERATQSLQEFKALASPK